MGWEIVEVNQGQLSGIRINLDKKEQDRLQQWWEIDRGANRSSTVSNIALFLL